MERRVRHCYNIRKTLFAGTKADHMLAVLSRVAGKDASKQFWKYHNEGVLKKYKGKLQVGSLNTKKAAAAPPPAPAPAKEAPKPKPAPAPAASTSAAPAQAPQPHDPYGELIPFADPSWYHGVSHILGQPVWRDPRADICLPKYSNSLLTITKLTKPSVLKFANGLSLRLSHM